MSTSPPVARRRDMELWWMRESETPSSAHASGSSSDGTMRLTCVGIWRALIEGRALLLPRAPLDSVNFLSLLPVLQARAQISRYRSARTGVPHCDDLYPPAVCIRTPPTPMTEAGIVCTTGSRPKCRRSAHGY